MVFLKIFNLISRIKDSSTIIIVIYHLIYQLKSLIFHNLSKKKVDLILIYKLMELNGKINHQDYCIE